MNKILRELKASDARKAMPSKEDCVKECLRWFFDVIEFACVEKGQSSWQSCTPYQYDEDVRIEVFERLRSLGYELTEVNRNGEILVIIKW